MTIDPVSHPASDTLQRILVVDDNDDIRRSVSIVLRRKGHAASSARDGLECVQAVRDGFRGVILLDIMMPNLDGWKTVRTLAEGGLLSGNLICMLTACAEPGPEAEGLEEHIFDYLPKPFQGEDLVRLVENALSCLVA